MKGLGVYWAVGPVWGHLVVWWQVYIYKEVRVSELRTDYGHEGLGRQSEEKGLLDLTE